jgi:hypothetical protein
MGLQGFCKKNSYRNITSFTWQITNGALARLLTGGKTPLLQWNAIQFLISHYHGIPVTNAQNQ